jgi:hypothetical protein
MYEGDQAGKHNPVSEDEEGINGTQLHKCNWAIEAIHGIVLVVKAWPLLQTFAISGVVNTP